MQRTQAIVAALAVGWSVGCAFDGSQLDFTIDPDAETRCEVMPDHVRCDHVTITIATGALGLAAREVHFMHPVGEAPAAGWPVVILFQGSLHPADGFFEGDAADEYGGLNQARVVAALLDAGYATLAPDARYDGATYWDTNVVPYNVAWDTSEDHQLMVELFRLIEDGELGPLDASHLYATGISSGGYMTSRMAVSYPGRFDALAIQSASYATCAGALCDVPELPADHPPTLFLHGAMDDIVPIDTAHAYETKLEGQGTEVRFVEDGEARHEWLDAAPEEIVGWFGGHR